MITEQVPETWEELQDWTAQVLRECGWQAQTQVEVDTVRGRVELDVIATEEIRGRRYTTVVECKNWKSKVPQTVVHGFRTIISDVGANSGYIISRAGFQPGSYRAARNTNIKLFTGREFQIEFEDQWYWEYFVEEVRLKLDPLISYLEPLPAIVHWDEYLNEAEINELKEMYHAHFELGALIMLMHPVQKSFGALRERVSLPLRVRDGERNHLPSEITSQTAYREFLHKLESYALPILRKFQSYKRIALERKDNASR